MKKFDLRISIGLVLTFVTMATPALATCDGEPNCLGIYFDEDIWQQTCLETAPAQPFDMYFVLQDCQFETIGGIEFAWRYSPLPDPEPLIVSYWSPSPVWDPSDLQNILMGFGVPLPVAGPTVVLGLTLLPLAEVAADLQLGPSTPASLPGQAAINDGANPSDIVPLTFGVPVDATGWTVSGVAQLGDCEVGTESVVWGSVKALFRDATR